MVRNIISKGPNFVHPEKPGAVGSRNSLNRHQRDEYVEAKIVIDEEVDKILNHIHAKLPPEVLEKLDVMGSIKSKLHNYFNQEFQNMLNRYIVTMEDEMGKKVRDLIDKEENRALNRYSPREIAEIIDRIGGSDKFNTGEVEKSIVNMYGHLQGHIQRGVTELETNTNSLLREKSDVGAFVRGENAYAVVKCSFKDNRYKPKNVTDLKLSINILDSELISPVYHYQVPVVKIIQDVVAKHIHDIIDREITELNNSLLDSGKEQLDNTEAVFEKLRVIENYLGDEDPSDENAKRYQFVAKKFVDAVEGIKAEIDPETYDPLQLRENVKKIVDQENIRNRGFNTAVNSLTAILDTSRMGYQHVENYKNARECIIREYEEENSALLPDEHYNIRLVYYDFDQIKALRDAYITQLIELEKATQKLWDVVDGIYVEWRGEQQKEDWELLSKRILGESQSKGSWFNSSASDEDEDEGSEKVWDEVSFIEPEGGVVNETNPTYEMRIEKLSNRFRIMGSQVDKIFALNYPQKRRVVEDRMQFLEEKVNDFNNLINPYHIQPGLLLEVDIVSIKRKRTTMMNMANVLNEFLFSVSKGFADAAFASFARRRSTVRDDLEQTFTSYSSEEGEDQVEDSE